MTQLYQRWHVRETIDTRACVAVALSPSSASVMFSYLRIVCVFALAACATTSEDGLRPPDRAASTYWRTMMGTGVPLDSALELYGDDLLRFLERETLALRAALARGAGPLVSDLAHVLELDAARVPALGAALREHRAEIEVPLVESGPFTADRARRLADLLRRVRP